jgi:hypothetical protein
MVNIIILGLISEVCGSNIYAEYPNLLQDKIVRQEPITGSMKEEFLYFTHTKYFWILS